MRNGKSRIYWPAYEKIEREVLAFSSTVFFDDNQSKVYSMDFAEIIIRCVIEIESVVKDIYRSETNKKAEAPGACIKWLESNWALNKKKIHIVTPYFHYKENASFCPFDYSGKSEDDFYSAYNAIKHDRAKNMHKATIHVMLRALAALFILITYYEGEPIELGSKSLPYEIEKTGGSKIFEFDVVPCEDEIMADDEEIDPDTCLYKIVKVSKYSYAIRYVNNLNEIDQIDILYYDEGFQEDLRRQLGQRVNEEDMWNHLKPFSKLESEDVREKFYKFTKAKKIVAIVVGHTKSTFWAELNK